uniref:Chaperone, TCP1-related n=1 Tax=Avena sativa TaxID=4498 RepID=Q7M1G6_AVESA
ALESAKLGPWWIGP